MAEMTVKLQDSPWNPVRIAPPEGEMMAIKKGTTNGPLDRIIASVEGWHFRGEEDGFSAPEEWQRWEMKPDLVNGERVFTPRRKEMPEQEFGIITVGFGRALHITHTRYTKWELPAGKTAAELVSKERKDSPYFFFQYAMAIPVIEAEAEGNLKLTIKMNVVVRLINPYKALFMAGGWESTLDGAVQGAVRDYVSHMKIENVRAEKESDLLEARIKELNATGKGRGGDFKLRFGVEVIDTRFISFEIIGGEKVQNAVEAMEVNRLNAEAAKEKAREIVTLATAEAEAAAKLVAVYGREGAAAVRNAELMRDALVHTRASVVAIGGANTPPIAITPTVTPATPPPAPKKTP